MQPLVRRSVRLSLHNIKRHLIKMVSRVQMNRSSKIELHPNKIRITEGNKTCVSLFSGVLGLEIGLHKAGFATKLAIDIDKSAKETVGHNFPELDYVVKNVSDVTPSFILERTGLKNGELSLLSGGLPCQPFSKSGLRKGLTDKRGVLFKHYIELLDGLEPHAFVIENVRGLLSSNGGKDFRKILAEFRKTGYVLYCACMDAANYGVPQFRQRLFLVGFKKRIAFLFPEKTHGDGERPSSKLSGFFSAQYAFKGLGDIRDFPPYVGKYAHLLQEIPEGLNYSYYTKERGHPNPLFEWRSKFWYFLMKMDRNRPSLTLQAYPGNNTGPFHWENRKLGLSELKRLQTFPYWFEFKCSYLTNHRHIGNAVPPLLAYKIGFQISRSLDEENIISEERYKEYVEENSGFSRCRVDSGRRSGKGRLYVVNGRTVLVNRKKANTFVSIILEWLSDNQRDFPWRKTSDPYKILITEHLLRKTTAKQVKNIYEQFFTAFPGFVELFEAPKGKIIDIIRSLGLQNQRAQLLHRISGALVELREVPRKESALMNLQGIGQYCSDGVRCMAYGEDVPMVDRNTVRVIDRFFSVLSRNESALSEKAAKTIRGFVKTFLPSGNSKAFNLALLDFAALVCRARKPICNSCPLNDLCCWYSIKKENGNNGRRIEN